MMEVSLAVAFLAGVGSFFSPCIFPLLPVYFSVLSGVSVKELGAAVRRVFLAALFFVLGFSAVFMALGASFGSFGHLLIRWRAPLQVIGGVVVMVLALHLLGLRFLPVLLRERKWHPGEIRLPLIGPFLVGAAFAFGWSPCVGPILGSILTYAMAGQDPKRGLVLLGVYSMGLAVPFLLISLCWNRFIALFSSLKRGLRWVNAASGLILLVMGGWLIFKGAGL